MSWRWGFLCVLRISGYIDIDFTFDVKTGSDLLTFRMTMMMISICPSSNRQAVERQSPCFCPKLAPPSSPPSSPTANASSARFSLPHDDQSIHWTPFSYSAQHRLAGIIWRTYKWFLWKKNMPQRQLNIPSSFPVLPFPNIKITIPVIEMIKIIISDRWSMMKRTMIW